MRKKKRTPKLLKRKNLNKKSSVDVVQIHYLNLLFLTKFLNPRFEMYNRSKTRLTRKEQFLVRKSIIFAREIGLLPHIKYS